MYANDLILEMMHLAVSRMTFGLCMTLFLVFRDASIVAALGFKAPALCRKEYLISSILVVGRSMLWSGWCTGGDEWHESKFRFGIGLMLL